MRVRTPLISLAAFASLMSLAACAPAPGPGKTVEVLYAPYLSHAAEQGDPNWDSAPVYSKALKAEIDRGLEYGRLLNEPVIDFDPIADGQDFSLSNLKVDVDQPPKDGKAHVAAHFDNQGKPTMVGYDMIKEDGAWKIDAIRGDQDDLRKLIEEALKPIADPEAMKAPIKVVYEMYAPPHSGASEPLYKWAPLTKTFAALLQSAATRHIQGAGKDGLGFDPVTDGQALADATIDLEAASSAVIVRIGDGKAQHIIVYDLAQEDGEWKIDDIRGPEAASPWDLRTQLDTPPG